MADAALKLARKALAGGGPTAEADAARTLRFYVDRERQVSSDKRIWAAMLYLYGQLGDEASCDECRRELSRLSTVAQLTPRRKARGEAVECGTRKEPSTEAVEKRLQRVEATKERLRASRERSATLFDVADGEEGEEFHFASWKLRLLRSAGGLPALGSNDGSIDF